MICPKILPVVIFPLAIIGCSLSTEVSHDGRALKIDGERKIIISGSIHYPRSTVEMWPDLIKKAKAGGLDAIETYVFWNVHEPVRRQYDFSGNLDLVRFMKAVQNEGLHAILRIGPYVCAEWTYGGFPVWLHNLPEIELRTNNTVYMNEMQNFTTLIVDLMKKESLFASQGGPIILAQIENEYGNIMSPYGEGGKEYVKWCVQMAVSLNIGVPWIMCQQEDAPQPAISTCNGFYCHQFTPNNPNSPKMWTENWTGWFKNWGGANPHRTAEDIAYAVARFYQTGGTLQNYYMYHGGTNFGRTAGGPYITTSYDYDAPLNEYGGLNQPKYGHLRELHKVLHSMERSLTYGNASTIDYGNNITATVFDLNGNKSCMFSNDANSTTDATIKHEGIEHKIPAWSVTILPDCKNEVFNTAKVNTQTTLLEPKPNQAENEPSALKWVWRPELVEDTIVHGIGEISATGLLDQKATNDVSDYFWYMTSVNLDNDDPLWKASNIILRVNTTGSTLHAYVNGEFIGVQWGNNSNVQFSYEKIVQLSPGINQLTLLSATVGLQNYGSYFDTIPNGLPGPVELVGTKDDMTMTKDLSMHKWTYKVGLEGLDKEFYFSTNKSSSEWRSDNLPTNRMFTWYKSTFKAPLGQDPVVLDLQSMGKGYVWVNGHNLGRYWPKSLAQNDGCSNDPCDYRGTYSPDKCTYNCGQSTQKWYHVPRSFLKEGENEIILFEELGGDPSHVNFQTLKVGTICADTSENRTVELSCTGGKISAIKFVSFGNPKGQCGSFQWGSCQSNTAANVVVKECLGKESCMVTASDSVLGHTNCGVEVEKRLAVEASCS